MKRSLLAAPAALLLAAAGCMTALPPGDPPAGGITDNGETAKELPPAARRSRLATRLAAAALAASPRWKTLAVECDAELLPLAEAAAREAAAVAAFAVKRGGPAAPEPGSARLLGSRRGNEWEFTLLSPAGALLWRELFSVGCVLKDD